MRGQKTQILLNPGGLLPELVVVFSIDPGGMTGWSAMGVLPEALVEPDLKVLPNIKLWNHGEINCHEERGAVEGKDWDEWAKLQGHQAKLRHGSSNFKSLQHAMIFRKQMGERIFGENAGVSDILDIIGGYEECCVLIEDWIALSFNQSRDFLSPVRIASAIDRELWLQGRMSFRQMPSEAINKGKNPGGISDQQLKDWGFYVREGGLGHARDADRHSLQWLKKAKAAGGGRKARLMRAACWPHLFGPGAPYWQEIPELSEAAMQRKAERAARPAKALRSTRRGKRL